MMVCHCNVLDSRQLESSLQTHFEAVAAKETLLEAVALVHALAINEKGDTPKLTSCTACFNTTQTMVQERGLFTNETLPDRIPYCQTCPRRAALNGALTRG